MPYGFNEDKSKYDLTEIEDVVNGLLNLKEATATYTSNFQKYNVNGSFPKFHKIGRLCMVTGAARPTATITGSQSIVDMFTIPEGFRPIEDYTTLQQGSSNHIWDFTLRANGRATFSRLRNGNTSQDAGTSEWLPFYATYICEE